MSHLSPDPLPNVIYSVILEDAPVHCPPYYFCATDDPTCPCHDPSLNRAAFLLLTQEYRSGLLTSEEARRIVQGRQVNS